MLKGLNKAPRIANKGISVHDIGFMVSPYGCWGAPHDLCHANDIPVIIVKENKTVLDSSGDWMNPIFVENYWEAVGVIMSMKAGIDRWSVRRPVAELKRR